MSDQYFKIRFDLICSDFLRTPDWRKTACAKLMLKILSSLEYRRLWKDIRSFYKDIINNEFITGDFPAYEQDDTKRMAIELMTDLFCVVGYFSMINPLGAVNLNQPEVEITLNENNEEDFAVLFAFRFTKTMHRIDFLDFHLDYSFKKDFKKYKLFLYRVIENLPANTSHYIMEYIASHNKDRKNDNASQGRKRRKHTPKLNLNFYFEKNVDGIRKLISDFFFSADGRIRGDKGDKVGRLGLELKKIIDQIGGETYNATTMSDILLSEFGEQLRITKETLRGYITKSKLKALTLKGSTEAQEQLAVRLKNLLNQNKSTTTPQQLPNLTHED